MNIFQLQDDTIKFLQTDGFLNPVPMYAANKADLEQLVEIAAGKTGIVVVVEPVQGSISHSGGNVFVEPTFAFTITEMPIINRAPGGLGKSAEEVMIRIAWRLSSTFGAPMFSRSFQLVDDLGDSLTYQLTAVARGKIEVTP